jgi:hypothetical protein
MAGRGGQLMPLVLKSIAVVAATSVAFTLLLVVLIVGRGGFTPLLNAGVFGVVTLLGWVVGLTFGPLATVHLWQLRERGRIAALILFGYGCLYYLVGYVWLRTPEAPSTQIIAAAIAHLVPVLILASPQARRACS